MNTFFHTIAQKFHRWPSSALCSFYVTMCTVFRWQCIHWPIFESCKFERDFKPAMLSGIPSYSSTIKHLCINNWRSQHMPRGLRRSTRCTERWWICACKFHLLQNTKNWYKFSRHLKLVPIWKICWGCYLKKKGLLLSDAAADVIIVLL